MSSNTNEEIFKEELFKKYGEGKTSLIPKVEYYTLMDDVKSAVIQTTTKSRNGYYLLSK